MADRLRVTELDFDTIKNNLKIFLNQQTLFTDYDFSGSGLNILLDILAYNTHYQAYYLNMVANEAFLDTALLRESVVSHAKTLGYTPYSKRASIASINVEVPAGSNTVAQLTLPRGFSFLSNQIDGISYNFVVLEDTTVTKSNTSYYFENLPIYEGQLVNYTFIQDQAANPNQIFIIPDSSVDISSLTISVSPSTSNTSLTFFNIATDLTEIKSDTPVYFIQESISGNYQFYFGDNVVGQGVPDGGVIYANYLVTNSSAANKANNFIATGGVTDSISTSLTNFIITPVSSATGGIDKETIESIKYYAPLSYISQNRLITTKDYEVQIHKAFPDINSVSVWGGEDEIPPIFGKVFISLMPAENYYLSEAEKNIILNSIAPKSGLTVNAEIRDPEFLYVLLNITTHYDQTRTMLNSSGLQSLIFNAVSLYNSTYLNTFSSKFVQSKLEEIINDVDTNSIVGCESLIRVQKRFLPILGVVNNYNINFNIPILQRNSLSKLTSSDFSVYDSNGKIQIVSIEEVPNSFSGINSISLIDAGAFYTSIPTVIINGDGKGATAIANMVNGNIESIAVTDPGIDYTTATVTITGGGGFGASATAVINSTIGVLRTIYYTSSAQRQIVNPNIGSIDYSSGTVSLNNLNIISIQTFDGLMRIDCTSQSGIINSNKNNIISIDENDPYSITINVVSK